MALAIEGATLGGEVVGLRIEGERIAAIGPGVAAEQGDERLDGSGAAIVPGLVNGHTHAAMTLFRGHVDDVPLMEWLERHIWPVEARLDDEDVYWGTRLACVEMIRTGTVRFWDMYWRPGAVARAVGDAGLRATIGPPLIDGGDGSRLDDVRSAAAEGLEAIAAAGAELASPSLAPHAIYTVSPRSLEWIGTESERLGIPVQIHVSETEQEVADCRSAHGVRPVELLDRVGLLGPRTLLAHGVWLDDRERELIASAAATVVTNPVANMKLAVGGIFDLGAAQYHGIAVGLGTDGAGSNNSLDLLDDAKHLALGQKHRAADAAASPAAEALAIATGARAPLLGATPLEPGHPADLLLVRTDGHELGIGSLDAGLVYAATGSVVKATIVAGRVLMRDGVVAGEAEVVERARERCRRLGLAA
ncbi:MAG TPA: amidohydrolase [Solirubrobacterales bacterium]|nr:amidohydrolase [Solirubrobacterales bacterium]